MSLLSYGIFYCLIKLPLYPACLPVYIMTHVGLVTKKKKNLIFTIFFRKSFLSAIDVIRWMGIFCISLISVTHHVYVIFLFFFQKFRERNVKWSSYYWQTLNYQCHGNHRQRRIWYPRCTVICYPASGHLLFRHREKISCKFAII